MRSYGKLPSSFLIQFNLGDFSEDCQCITILEIPSWFLTFRQDSNIRLRHSLGDRTRETLFYFHATQIQVNVKFPNRIEANYNLSQSRDDPSYAKTPQVRPMRILSVENSMRAPRFSLYVQIWEDPLQSQILCHPQSSSDLLFSV